VIDKQLEAFARQVEPQHEMAAAYMREAARDMRTLRSLLYEVWNYEGLDGQGLKEMRRLMKAVSPGVESDATTRDHAK